MHTAFATQSVESEVGEQGWPMALVPRVRQPPEVSSAETETHSLFPPQLVTNGVQDG